MEKEQRPEYSDIKHENNVIKSLWSQFNVLEVRDGLLCRRWEDNEEVSYQIVIPLSERREILQECHDARTSGHLGISKTLARVRENFYWTGL